MTKTGYFKRFFVSQNGKNVYRDQFNEIMAIGGDISLFFTDSFLDQGATKQFIKQDSVLVKQIKEIYVVPPAETLPFIKMLQADNAKLKQKLSELDSQVQDLQSNMQDIMKFIKRKSDKKEASKSAR